MNTIWIYALISVIAVSLLSLIGLFTFSLKEKKLKGIIFALVALSVGALFGDVFIHILPEIFRNSLNILLTSTYIILGILIFFILEKFLSWHHHHDCGDENCPEHKPTPVGKMILVSDGLHNFIDGIIIGASYLVSIPLGLATTLAVVLHEIPQEIGNFGVLLHSGYSRTKALLYNFISALFAVLGVFVPLFLIKDTESLIQVILPITAGGFIYIAGSDLIPELHKTSDSKKSFIQLIFILLGLGLMYLLFFVE